jgi:hypothetical protein
MITIVTVDETILERAARVTGIRDKTALVRRSLESLTARESARRLAVLAGSEKEPRAVPERHSDDGQIRRIGLSVIPDPAADAAADAAANPAAAAAADAGGNGRR